MIAALIVISFVALALLICLALACVNLVDLNTTVGQLHNQLAQKEEILNRAQDLVLKKFGYRFPLSDKYLSVEEIQFEREQKSK